MLKYIVLKTHKLTKEDFNKYSFLFKKGFILKVKMSHSSYMARKVATDLFNNQQITVNSGIEHISKIVQELIAKDIQQEVDLENKINDMMEEQEDNDEFEYMDVNYGQVFWMVKRRLAKETGFELDFEDRYSDLSHKIVDELWREDAIKYEISDIIIKNIVFDALFKYINEFSNIEKDIERQISNYKREVIPGTEDYFAIYDKLYSIELRKHGLA